MAKKRVLYVCHNHPSVRPGGAETYALELYEGMRRSDTFEPLFLAKGGPPISPERRPHEGTLLGRINDDPNQYLFYTEETDFDWFYLTSRNKDVYVKFFREFLLASQPDIVHFQHTLFFGYDIIRETKTTLPHVPIVYTLHEFVPICHRNGQMVRRQDNALCTGWSPRRCHECFPEFTPQAFFLRKRFIESHLSMVDLFLAPSRLVLERYVEWGIPREKLRHEENGRTVAQISADVEEERSRTRLGFFGQFTAYKGVDVLLRAMSILGQDEPRVRLAAPLVAHRPPGEPAAGGGSRRADERVHLWLHGTNLELQPGAFQNEFTSLLEAANGNVTLVGRYVPGELPELMRKTDWVVVPSIWWENSPLVIQEAFLNRRPVICSDIGGMAEKVTHGVNGLHFRVGDAESLADTIRKAAATPGLWEKLRRGIPHVYRMEDHVRALAEIYRTLLDQGQPRGLADA